MNAELMQLLYYAGFAVLGWWLRHRGVLGPGSPTLPSTAPASPGDQKILVELVKTLLDRLSQPSAAAPPVGPNSIVHVPIEITAAPRAPLAGGS